MNIKLIKSIGISIILDIFISAIIAAGCVAFGFNFWSTLLIAFGSFFMISYIINIISSSIVGFKLLKVKELNKRRESEQEIELSCAGCNSQNYVFLDLKKDNEFKCAKCLKRNAIYMEFTTAVITEPLIAKIDLPKNLEDIKDE